MKRGSVLFLLGVAVGLVGSLVLPRVLPVSWRLALGSVEGTVEAERLDDGRLLLTLSTQHGVTLASFEEDVEKIALLVELGDHVTLAARDYRPFLEDPVIARVERGPAVAPPVELAEEEASAPEEVPSGALEEEAEAGEEALPVEGQAEPDQTIPNGSL